MNPNICRKHDKPMSECGCRLKDTKASTEPDTGVCCYCTYHGWTQCEEGCKQRHPYGSGRWQHVLELNARVTFRNCSDEAQYLAAFKRHKVEQQQRVRRQREENKENWDSDHDLPDRTADSEEEDDDATESRVAVLQDEVARLKELLKELNEEKEQELERHRKRAREVQSRIQELIVERNKPTEEEAPAAQQQSCLSAEQEQRLREREDLLPELALRLGTWPEVPLRQGGWPPPQGPRGWGAEDSTTVPAHAGAVLALEATS